MGVDESYEAARRQEVIGVELNAAQYREEAARLDLERAKLALERERPGVANKAAERIANALERFVEIVEVAASGWLNARPPRGGYRPLLNPGYRQESDDNVPALCEHPGCNRHGERTGLNGEMEYACDAHWPAGGSR
jgi:hypothetical protein